MKFEAITLEGKKVVGVGVSMSNENYESWIFGSRTGMKDDDYIYAKDLTDKYGSSLSYLFKNSIHWVDGREFEVDDFEMVYTKSIKIIK